MHEKVKLVGFFPTNSVYLFCQTIYFFFTLSFLSQKIKHAGIIWDMMLKMFEIVKTDFHR